MPVAAPSAAAPAGSALSGAAPSASSGAGAAASQSPSPAASAESPSPAAESSAPPTGQGGQAGDADWKRVAFRALGCKHHADLPDRAEVQHVDHADLTGDGRRDAIVAASCPSTTSTNAVRVFVFGASSTSEKPLLTIGKDAYLRTADVQVSGRTLTVDSEALSDEASLCCPDLRVKQSWKWDGSAFVRTGFESDAT